MDSSSRASFRACEISIRVCGRNALCTSGRQIVIFAMPSSVVSYRMSSYLPDSCQAISAGGLVGSVMVSILRHTPNHPAGR